MDDLYVITAIFNPWRYRSRSALYWDFERHMHQSGAKLYTIEAAFSDREFEVTQANNPHHIQVRTDQELWHKEKMLNLAMQRLPIDWKYVAWIDADVLFSRNNWVSETIYRLQHYKILQLFSQAVDTGPNCEHMKVHTSVIYAFNEGVMEGDPKKRYDHLHPGFAWAARRDAMNELGGLLDFAVLGSADRHMALSLINKGECSYPKGVSSSYVNKLKAYQERCMKHIKKNVGHLPGTIIHYWHGKKVDRRYHDRWKILVKHKFDPDTDLMQDEQGMWRYTGNKPEMEQDIRKYFTSRNEDSIDKE